MRKTKAKRPIAKSRATSPEIYVKVAAEWPRSYSYAKAKIRIRQGEYQYLQWREAGKVRSFYLGRKRKS